MNSYIGIILLMHLAVSFFIALNQYKLYWKVISSKDDHIKELEGKLKKAYADRHYLQTANEALAKVVELQKGQKYET
jgi:hypothetical protein